MPCCCTNILNLCNVPVCGVLEIEQAAIGQSGSGEVNNYTLVLDFLETQVTLTQEQTEGENITFDVSMLNENFQYTGQVFDSAGDLVSVTVEDIIYDCVKFKTIINVSL